MMKTASGNEQLPFVLKIITRMRLVSYGKIISPVAIMKFLCFKVLLVSSSRTPDKWIVPGGGLEPDEGSFEAAEREVMEEAGIRGTYSRSLGQFEVRNSREKPVNHVFCRI